MDFWLHLGFSVMEVKNFFEKFNGKFLHGAHIELIRSRHLYEVANRRPTRFEYLINFFRPLNMVLLDNLRELLRILLYVPLKKCLEVVPL